MKTKHKVTWLLPKGKGRNTVEYVKVNESEEEKQTKAGGASGKVLEEIRGVRGLGEHAAVERAFASDESVTAAASLVH